MKLIWRKLQEESQVSTTRDDDDINWGKRKAALHEEARLRAAMVSRAEREAESGCVRSAGEEQGREEEEGGGS